MFELNIRGIEHKLGRDDFFILGWFCLGMADGILKQRKIREKITGR